MGQTLARTMAILAFGLLALAAGPAAAQKVDRQIDFTVDYRASPKGSSSFNCKWGVLLRVTGGKAYLGVKLSRCGESLSKGAADQGWVFDLTGHTVSQRYTCKAEGNYTVCSNGDRMKMSGGSSAADLEPEFRTYSVTKSYVAKSTANGFSYDLTERNVFSARNSSTIKTSVAIAIDNNTCRVTNYRTSTTGTTSYGPFSSSSKMTGQSCRVIK